MDTELKCNRLTCRRPVSDRAVVTTCSHIFCVDCANELFNSSRLCPACETPLTEPDDVVVSSLHPTNDYKTSVLSGLSPSVILEICNRAISFWQYQIHQENAFQQAVVRNMNDKNAQLQKQLENVVREANSEVNLLTNKVAELERDLELERRKVREVHEASRERDKEYQKLKAQHDKIKRKALLAPDSGGAPQGNIGFTTAEGYPRHLPQNPNSNQSLNVGAVVGGMQANGIQRTPLIARNGGGQYLQQNAAPANSGWGGKSQQRRPFPQAGYRSGTASDRSESANEIENMLMSGNMPARREGGWGGDTQRRQSNPGTVQRVFAPASVKRGFRPAPVQR
ncbi:RING-type domain-containing protein [Pleurotus pulmonarius]